MGPNRKSRQLASGYSAEVDLVNEQTWSQLLLDFDDANIYQTWAYAEVMSHTNNMSQLVLKKQGEIVAIAQVRIARLPVINLGIAYVFWGPIWRRRGRETDEETFRQAIRALRAEYASKRGLTLRVFPLLFDLHAPSFLKILEEEGFSSAGSEQRGRTILMDLSPSIEELRAGTNSHWKREMKVAERGSLEVTESSDDVQFEAFVAIYREMVSRKQFVESNDINKFRLIQSKLPEPLKMKVLLCRSHEDVCAGLVCSSIGKTAVYLFGATSNVGMKSRGSYLLQWRLIEQLKQEGTRIYDLNGINPVKNPGTHKFKCDLAGKHGTDTHFLGRFDAHGSLFSRLCVQAGDHFRTKQRSLRAFVKAMRTARTRSSLAG